MNNVNNLKRGSSSDEDSQSKRLKSDSDLDDNQIIDLDAFNLNLKPELCSDQKFNNGVFSVLKKVETSMITASDCRKQHFIRAMYNPSKENLAVSFCSLIGFFVGTTNVYNEYDNNTHFILDEFGHSMTLFKKMAIIYYNHKPRMMFTHFRYCPHDKSQTCVCNIYGPVKFRVYYRNGYNKLLKNNTFFKQNFNVIQSERDFIKEGIFQECSVLFIPYDFTREREDDFVADGKFMSHNVCKMDQNGHNYFASDIYDEQNVIPGPDFYNYIRDLKKISRHTDSLCYSYRIKVAMNFIKKIFFCTDVSIDSISRNIRDQFKDILSCIFRHIVMCVNYSFKIGINNENEDFEMENYHTKNTVKTSFKRNLSMRIYSSN